jgi:thiopeptide-type bacteriocin biosynthesis protein
MPAAGFFVLRTPFLPFDTAVRLGDGLEAPAALGDRHRLIDALSRDRARVRARLQTLANTAAIRDAIFVASPDLALAIDRWLDVPADDRADATDQSVMRYVTRMAARATPFGLFAGSGVGTIGPTTELLVCAPNGCSRQTRLDMDYVVLLAEALGRETALASSIRYTPNSSLYRSADRWRYVETRVANKTRSHHLVTLDDSEPLTATLDRAHDGATRAALAAALVDQNIDVEEADGFVGELIESQILVPDIECPITGREPLTHLEAIARRFAAGAATADRLAMIAADLDSIDLGGVGASPTRYRHIAACLEALPAKVDPTRLFQVDLVRPAASATLGRHVLDEIGRGVEILRRLVPPFDYDRLASVRTAFAERYEGREVPLVEALDEESGIGAALTEGSDRDAAPLLRTLDFPPAPAPTTPWGRREDGLLARVGQTLLDGRHELALTPRDIDALTNKDAPPLPDAYSVMVTLISRGDPQDGPGDYRVLLRYAAGPSGAPLLGRFCHADPDLLAWVRRHLRAEEALDPEALFAEIVHLPEGRLGNILRRPLLREYEIPYLGRSGAPVERQIPVSDLSVALVNGHFVLRSRRLGRRIVPRLTSAHNFSHQSLTIYRFLCLLQAEGRLGACSWTWGALASLPFLPRVTCDRLVFSRAMWRVTKQEIRTLTAATGDRRYAAVQSWRAARRLPRWVVVADDDNALPVDLDNVVAVESLVHVLKGREDATLTELYPGPDELCAVGPDGRYAHELLIPFHGRARTDAAGTEVAPRGRRFAGTPRLRSRQAEVAGTPRLRSGQAEVAGTPRLRSGQAEVDRLRQPVAVAAAIRRTFPPGAEWIYAKLYAGAGTADRLLTEVIGPVSRKLLAVGATDRWFFIRYADPDEHVRWRLHVTPGKRPAAVRGRIETVAASLIDAGRVRRLVFDTYEREIERYGGSAGIEAAETWFWADSETIVDLLTTLDAGDAGAELRWQVAIPSVDSLLTDLGLDLEAKFHATQKLRDRVGREFHADAALGRQLAAKFRSARQDLERLLEPGGANHSSGAWGEVLAERSTKARPVLDALQASARSGLLTSTVPQLAESYVHMHLNRLFRSQQRAHELVIYDFLVCLYESRLARGRASAT